MITLFLVVFLDLVGFGMILGVIATASVMTVAGAAVGSLAGHLAGDVEVRPAAKEAHANAKK